MNITKFAVNRRLATFAIITAAVAIGIYGYIRLPVNFLPELTYPLVKVQIKWPGATATEVENEIAEPLERFMATVDRLDYLESFSMEGVYNLDVYFIFGADIDVAFQDVLAAMNRAQEKLPKDTEAPYLFKADPSQLPVIKLTASSSVWTPVRLRDWADNWLQDRLLSVRGVAGTEVVGGHEREIRIQMDPQAMEKHNLALDTILSRISAENVEQTGGRVTVGNKEVIARTMGEFSSLDDIRRVVLSEDEYRKVYVRDVAEVVDSHKDVRMKVRFNGVNGVYISVWKEAEANTVSVAEAVAKALEELRPNLPPGLEINFVENQATYIRESLAGVANAAFAAAVLLIVVIYIFLGSFRMVGVMLIALPLILVVNFGLMAFAGFSLNIFSLGGIVVALGVVLDNSIVVVENIVRLRREEGAGDSYAVAYKATREVGSALVAAAVSFLALFLPFLMVPGLTSIMFRELILVIASLAVLSLILAITVTPMLAGLFFSRKGGEENWFDRIFSKVVGAYKRILTLAVRWRLVVTVGFLCLLATSGVMVKGLKSEFMPLIDDGRVLVKVRMATGSSVDETDRTLQAIEDRIADDPLIESIFTLVGGLPKGPMTNEIANEGELNIQLVPKAERNISTQEYIARLRKIVAQMQPPGGIAMARQMSIKGVFGMQGSDITLQVQGQEMEVISDLAERTVREINRQEGFQNVSISMDISKPEYHVRVDRMKAAELGISVSQVAASLRALISGNIVTRFHEGSEYYNIRILIPEYKINSRQDVENLEVSRSTGSAIRIRDIATVEPAVGPVEINRKNQIKQITIEADVNDGNLSAAIRRLEEVFPKLERPVGYSFIFGGRAEMMADMMKAMITVFLFALFFSFIVLTVQFNSLRLPTLILGSIPFCLAGSIALLNLTGVPVGATVIIGLLVIIAATVNDGVLLLTYAQELENNGMERIRAVISAAVIRLRPRVMTTITTIVGFLPLALNMEEGGDMLQPMAMAAIGGLVMEMGVALFLMPCLYAFSWRRAEAKP